ncbi:MAG TPA: glycoside hydrolase domain-containing protein [Stellaceae bacterium]|nr:glycoside hydrolase domain-containing protein [Stellaceae bacterium]
MRLTNFALLFAALLLAGCASQPTPQPTAQLLSGPPGIHGIDMATDSSDVAGELQGRPWLHFVARYYRDPSSRWPALSPAEAQRLSAAGVKIVTVWEFHSGNVEYFSYASGYSDAMSAYRQARAVGQPPGSAIYFAVDFNARGPALYQIDQYFHGVNAGLAAAGGGRSLYPIGVYGSGAVCAQIKGEGLARYAWLSGSSSWEGTAGYTAWNIRQAPAGERFGNLSFSHDANEATNDYGGFRLAGYGGPESPAGAAVTAVAAVPATAATLVTGAVDAVVPHPAASAPPPPPAPTVVAAASPSPSLSPPASPPPAHAEMASAEPPPHASPLAALNPIASAEAAERAPAAKPADAGVMDLAALRSDTGRHTSAEPAVPLGPRRAEHGAKRQGPSRAETPAHAAKALAAPTRKGYAAPTNKHVAASAPRNPGGSSHAELHERGRQLSEPRRAEDHGSHLQAGRAGAVPVLHRPARGSVEQRRS